MVSSWILTPCQPHWIISDGREGEAEIEKEIKGMGVGERETGTERDRERGGERERETERERDGREAREREREGESRQRKISVTLRSADNERGSQTRERPPLAQKLGLVFYSHLKGNAQIDPRR